MNRRALSRRKNETKDTRGRAAMAKTQLTIGIRAKTHIKTGSHRHGGDWSLFSSILGLIRQYEPVWYADHPIKPFRDNKAFDRSIWLDDVEAKQRRIDEHRIFMQPTDPLYSREQTAHGEHGAQ